jgi:AcrR family transcriptional regulator
VSAKTGEGVELPRIGRPRRFEPETERRLLLDAGMQVIARSGFAPTTVNEVLSEAGLSTRAFYRHFPTSQALVRALLEREVASSARWLEHATSNAGDSIAAVEAWIDACLDLFYEPRRAARAALLQSPSFAPSLQELPDVTGRFCKPLEQALLAGHKAGVLSSPSPRDDAESVYGLIVASAGKLRRRRATRAAAKAQVVRFAWPALGLSLEREAGSGR